MALTLVATTPQRTTEVFVWEHGGQVIGRLSVPKEPIVEVYDYREGIVTTLDYQNGAYIMLQAGSMYRLPLFQDPEYRLVSATEKDSKTTRVGLSADGNSVWREDNYKPKKVEGGSKGKRFSLLAVWAPNVGYAKVVYDQQAEFDKSLDSFIREIERTPPSR